MESTIGFLQNGTEAQAVLVDTQGQVLAACGPHQACQTVVDILGAARELKLQPRGVGVVTDQRQDEERNLVWDMPAYSGSKIQAVTRGEILFGAGRIYGDMLVVQTDAILEAGIVLDGVSHPGPVGGAGHISVDRTAAWRCSCGLQGCLQAALSLSADGVIPRPIGLPRKLPAAPSVASAWLALGLVHLINILNPAALILSGSVTDGDGVLDWLALTVPLAVLPACRSGLQLVVRPSVTAVVAAAALVPSTLEQLRTSTGSA